MPKKLSLIRSQLTITKIFLRYGIPLELFNGPLKQNDDIQLVDI